ncbi:MAG: S8 family serine peptidase, partial [Brevefilum sp.]
MKKISPLRIVVTILLIVFGLPWFRTSNSSIVLAENQHQDEPDVDPELLEQLTRSDSVDYFIYFEEKADLSPAYNMPWKERGRFVYDRLTEVAYASQKSVRGYLDAQGVTFEAFWISNVIAVKSSSRATFEGLRSFPGVRALTAIPTVQLIEPVSIKEESAQPGIKIVESNLTHINADDAWALGYRGTNMVLGSIDTGVHFTHETLVKQYRGNQGGGIYDHAYNWWDAVLGQDSAYDDNNHGTHTVGIMVGDDGGNNQIGVAPDAQWIACKGLSGQGSGDGNDLLKCGEFMAAPWDLNGENPNPDLRPNAVNNSWGDCGQAYNDWYEDTIDSWLAAGIYPLFANGNAGGCRYSYPPDQNTVGNPARSYHVTGVGSTGKSNGEYAQHSNWGPTDSLDTLNPKGHPDMKPQVVSPGVNIRSSIA